jgi:hypothetical protein
LGQCRNHDNQKQTGPEVEYSEFVSSNDKNDDQCLTGPGKWGDGHDYVRKFETHRDSRLAGQAFYDCI